MIARHFTLNLYGIGVGGGVGGAFIEVAIYRKQRAQFSCDNELMNPKGEINNEKPQLKPCF